jgi:GTP-binding protein EngB required for normal cell division/flagellar motility protein MotE (MotC chaperone)
MNELIDYKTLVTEIRNDSVDILNEMDKKKEADVLKKQSDEVLDRGMPSLMFYGVYNAGKSSIINAIFKKKIADVGDVPTTSEVQNITWNNYLIADTPGIDAKNEHTLVTENEIKKHDVILFVIDDSNVDLKEFYSAFVTVLQMKKPVMIVINQKNGDEDSLNTSPKIQKLRQQIVENIRRESEKRNVPSIETMKNFHGIIPVNAMAAWDSFGLQGDDAELLYKESGIDDLVDNMQGILKASDGVKMFMPALDLIDDALKKGLDYAKSLSDSQFQKIYIEAKDGIESQKKNLYRKLIQKGRVKINDFGEKLISQNMNGTSANISEQDIILELKEIIRKEFEDVNVSLKNEFQLYSVNLQDCSVKTDLEQFQIQLPESKSGAKDDDDTLAEIAKILLSTGPLPPVVLDENPTLSIIKKTKGVSLADFAAAGAAAVVTDTPLVILAPVVIGLINKLRGEKEQKKSLEEQRDAVNEYNRQVEASINQHVAQIIECQQKIQREINKLEESYTQNVGTLVDVAFAAMLDGLTQEYTKKCDENQHLETMIGDIHHQREKIVKLRTSIVD